MRSRWVRLLKIALPLAATMLIAALFLYSVIEEQTGFSLEGVSFSSSDGLRLTRPRFSGRTDDGQPFHLTADWALPDAPDPTLIELGPLEGAFEADEDTTLGLQAGGGAFRPKANTVTLSEGVALRLLGRGRLTAATVDADLDAETLQAAGPVSGAGEGASLEAGSMRAERRAEGYVIWFEDGVRVRLDPGQAEGGRADDDE
jgi:hypothetical protein